MFQNIMVLGPNTILDIFCFEVVLGLLHFLVLSFYFYSNNVLFLIDFNLVVVILHFKDTIISNRSGTMTMSGL